jgi:hypothetical protein
VSDFTQMSHSGRLGAFPQVDRAAIRGSDVMGRNAQLGTPMSYTKVATQRYANRIPAQDGVYDAFAKRLAETAGVMKVADGFDPGAVIGPLIDMKAVEKVEAHIADAVKKGAKLVTGAIAMSESGQSKRRKKAS